MNTNIYKVSELVDKRPGAMYKVIYKDPEYGFDREAVLIFDDNGNARIVDASGKFSSKGAGEEIEVPLEDLRVIDVDDYRSKAQNYARLSLHGTEPDAIIYKGSQTPNKILSTKINGILSLSKLNQKLLCCIYTKVICL